MLTHMGKLHVTVIPFKQRSAQTLLQKLYLAAERRLGHMQAGCGASEVQFFSNGDETTQLM